MTQRILLLAIILMTGMATQAQRLSNTSLVRTEGRPAPEVVERTELPLNSFAAHSTPPSVPQAKGAGTAFYTQSFPSLPTGWTVMANTGSVNGWRWANAAPVGAGNSFPIMGLINSSSKGDGWLLYNADSVLNTAGATRPIGGAITSAAIPVGASHTNVMLSFQQYYRYSEGDTCYVDVSSNGTTWTSYPVYPNNTLSQFGFLYRNPTVNTINISSVVGGQANAYVRFRFISTAPTYSFNWLIDDLMLSDADATDLGITYSGIASVSDPNSGFTTGYGYTSIPVRFADTVFPITYLSNYGLGTVTGTTITAQYYLGSSLLATHTATVTTAPLGARDSAVVFNTGFKPTAIGNYAIALSINPSGDGTTSNNVDTIRFRVSDTVYATYGSKFTERNCYLSRPSATTLQYWGSRFTIANGQFDTLTSVTVAFRPETVAGQRVQAQLYKASGSGTTFTWDAITLSTTRTLTASDISTTGNVVLTNIPMRLFATGFGPLILGDGDYAIVLTTVNATNDVAVYSMEPPMPTAPALIGYQGQSATSANDGSLTFSAGNGIATGIVQVPLVHANFGYGRSLVGVKDAESVVLGAAFPNPAKTQVNIPFVLQQSGTAEVVVSNTIGQVVVSIKLGQTSAGKMQVAIVPTNTLVDGVYYYTVKVENGQATGRVVVRH
jgi:hypothetical protein